MSEGRPVVVSASLLSADPAHLAEEAASVVSAGAELLHLDVMDGHFVPPITYGPLVAQSLQKAGAPLDVHLMVDCLDYAVPAFAPFAEYLTVHVEATRHLHRVLGDIRSRGCKAGVAMNPATPPDFLPHVLDLVDLVLVMTVNPGWGGQECITQMLHKVSAVRELAARRGLSPVIEVDGGITGDNARDFIEAGADILVAGSYIFKSPQRKLAIDSLKNPRKDGHRS
ncbi:MAG: ribulose-phosphate 3-epimerase [Bacillota bacterium]